jgi:hypothetical protein
MSRPTQTLDQALTDSETAIGPLLEQWLAREESTRRANPKARPGPYEIRVGFAPIGEKRTPLVELSWNAEQATPAAVPGLMQAVRDKLLELFGSSPMGKIRFEAYHAKESGKTERNFYADRSIAPGAEEFAGYGGDAVYLRQQNMQLQNCVVSMAQQHTLVVQHLATLAAEGQKQIGVLATARTAASAAADAGGLWQVLGLVAVAVTWPVLQDAFGVRGATLPQMLELFRAKVSIAIKGDQARSQADQVIDVAPGAPVPPADVAGDAPTPHTQGDQPATSTSSPKPSSAREVFGFLRNAAKDPAFRADAQALFDSDPALKFELIQAMA